MPSCVVTQRSALKRGFLEALEQDMSAQGAADHGLIGGLTVKEIEAWSELAISGRR